MRLCSRRRSMPTCSPHDGFSTQHNRMRAPGSHEAIFISKLLHYTHGKMALYSGSTFITVRTFITILFFWIPSLTWLLAVAVHVLCFWNFKSTSFMSLCWSLPLLFVHVRVPCPSLDVRVWEYGNAFFHLFVSLIVDVLCHFLIIISRKALGFWFLYFYLEVLFSLRVNCCFSFTSTALCVSLPFVTLIHPPAY